MPSAPSETSTIDFNLLATRVFKVEGTTIFIGGEALKPEIRSILRDQAKYLQTSQLWEILNATATQEAADLALLQSTNFDQVQFAKALHHWNHVFLNLIHTLAKE